MYVIYLDESGNPNGWNNNQDHFIIGGLAIHEDWISRLGAELDDIQAAFFPSISIPLKLHAVDIFNGRDRFRNIRKAERQRMLDAVYEIIAQVQYPNVILFATAIHISAVKNSDQVIRDTFKDIVQRIDSFLTRLHGRNNPQKGLFIIDRSNSTEDRYRTLVAEFTNHDARHGYLGNIVDIPYFSHSDETRLLQLADFCAYAVFRYYERGDRQFFDKIMPRFDGRTKDGPRDGLKHIIQTAEPCECVACSQRRHED